ncbi:hypothetical protein BN1864_LIB5394:03241 [Pseudomonas sp. 1 R 17]|nr:hypothetical protein BN1864_LIB5394:03241 [Pseudomonas sp. 1 R 17]
MITLGNLERPVLLAAFAVATGHPVDTGDGRDGGAVDAGLGGEHSTDVLDRAGRQDQVALALDRPRAVDDAGGQAALAVAIDTQVAHGVDRGAEVFQAVDLEVHVAATEDQAVVVEQVVHRKIQAALAGDAAAHGPVLAAADQGADAEQFAGGGLLQVIDVDGQAPGLDRGAVGPVGFIEDQVAIGHQATADIVEADAAEVECTRAHVQYLAAGVLEAGGGEAQLVVGGLEATAVVEQAADGVAGLAGGAEGAHLAAVGEAGSVDVEGGGALDQATVNQGPGQADVDPVAGDLAAAIHIHTGQVHAIPSKQRAAAVVEVSGVDLRITGFGGDAATVVVEGAGGEGHAGLFTVDQAVAAVLQQAAGGQGQAIVGGQGTVVAIVDAVGEQGQQTLAGELASLVVNVGGALDQQRAGTRQLAIAIDQVADQVQGDCAATGEAAGAVVQGIAVQGEGTGAVDDAALAVVQQAADGEGLRAVAEQATVVAVVYAGGGDVQHLLGVHGTALVVQGIGGGAELAIGDHRAGIADVLGLELDVADGVARVIGVDPGLDDAAVGQLAVAGQCDAVAGGEGLAVFQGALGLCLEGGARVHGALGLQARGLDVHRTAGGGLGHAQVAVGVELNIATTGCQCAVELHTHAGFGAHQFDRTGIHAAQGRRVDGQFRLGAAVVGARGGFQALGVDVIASGNHGELARIDLGVDLGRTGNDLEAVDVAGVQALAVDGHRTAIHLVAVQAPGLVKNRLAGGQGDVGGIDKAATVTAHAIRVGHDDLGGLPRHFGVAAQLAGAAAVDFVEDDIRSAALEVRVADDDPAQLRALHHARGVVEDHAVGTDVVVLELVMGQPAAIGRGDVHHRNAVARLPEGSAGAADHNTLGLGQQRLPEQRVGQDQGQAALAQAFQGSNRANVHIQNLKAAVLNYRKKSRRK